MLFFLFYINANVQALPGNQSLPEIHGEAACLIDVQSGQTLFSKNPDEPLAPASTTKIMTALLAIEKGNLNDTITASKTLLNNKIVYGTQIYLEPGETMSLRDLLYATLLNSANDAAVTIAEHIGGNLNNFVDMMNQRAKEIGAKNTHFLNPSGLNQSGHVTTAHDLALIARVAYQNPVFADYVRTKSHVISRSKSNVPVEMFNENKLLWQDPNVDGIKTGYTAVAENCLVASATKDGRPVIGVILKSPGREIYSDMESLLKYGFDKYNNIVYKPAGTVIATLPVNNTPVELVLDQPIYLTEMKGGQKPIVNLKVLPLFTGLNEVESGQTVAKVEVWNGNDQISVSPLKAASTVKTAVSSREQTESFWIISLVLVAIIFILAAGTKRKRIQWLQQVRLRRKESN